MAIRLGGTVSGEHGVGLLKNGQLSRQWSPAAVELHRADQAARSTRRACSTPGRSCPEVRPHAHRRAGEAADRDLARTPVRCSRKMRKYASSSFVRSGGSIASRSASNSASEIVRLGRLAEHVARAAAVAELGLLAPQQVLGQPAGERLAQELLLRHARPGELRLGRQPQAPRDDGAVEERHARLEAVGHRHAVAALEVEVVQRLDGAHELAVQRRGIRKSHR